MFLSRLCRFGLWDILRVFVYSVPSHDLIHSHNYGPYLECDFILRIYVFFPMYIILACRINPCDCHPRYPLQWRHNERGGVSNHQPRDCLLNRLLKETSKPRVTGLCEGNSPVTGEFPAQRVSNAENVSIWWRHHPLIYPLKGSKSDIGLTPAAFIRSNTPDSKVRGANMGPSGTDRSQLGPVLAPWTLLSGTTINWYPKQRSTGY